MTRYASQAPTHDEALAASLRRDALLARPAGALLHQRPRSIEMTGGSVRGVLSLLRGHERRDVLSERVTALRERLRAKYGKFADSVDIVRAARDEDK